MAPTSPRCSSCARFRTNRARRQARRSTARTSFPLQPETPNQGKEQTVSRRGSGGAFVISFGAGGRLDARGGGRWFVVAHAASGNVAIIKNTSRRVASALLWQSWTERE